MDQELLKKLEKSAENFEQKSGQIDSIKKEVDALPSKLKSIEDKIPDVKPLETSVGDVKKTVDEIKAAQIVKDESDKANQKALDDLIAASKTNNNTPANKKTFSQNFGEAVEANWDSIQKVSKGQKFSMEMKVAGNMTISANLTGIGTESYGGQVILPGQAVNFRDLMPTTVSPNRTFVRHREKTTGEGAPAVQTEGSSKAQIDIDFEKVDTVNEYVAGFTRYSKHIAKELSFFTTTLPRILLRKFYTAENAKFWTDVTTTSGISTNVGSETDDVKVLIDAIGQQLNDNYVASYILVNPIQLARVNKLLYANGWNLPGGGVVSERNGQVFVYNVPLIQAAWVNSDKGLIIDNTYLERVEAEGLSIEFFEQDADNVTKNMITARIECMEAVNLMLPASARFWDFGNSA